MLRDYELTFVAKAGLEEEALTSLIDRVKGWVAGEGGDVVRIDRWGRRRLAYPIKKEREGQYIFMQVRTEPAQIVQVERNMNITEGILRFLFVLVETEPKAEAPQATE